MKLPAMKNRAFTLSRKEVSELITLLRCEFMGISRGQAQHAMLG
jgi:hypothetical protein